MVGHLSWSFMGFLDGVAPLAVGGQDYFFLPGLRKTTTVAREHYMPVTFRKNYHGRHRRHPAERVYTDRAHDVAVITVLA